VGGNCDAMETLVVSFVFSMDEGKFVSARLITNSEFGNFMRYNEIIVFTF